MVHAIVTGATGFIGRNLIKEFAKRSVKITAIVREGSSKVDFLKEIPSVTVASCSLSNFFNLPDRLGIAEPNTVFFHLAWEGTAGADRGDYELQLRNVMYTVEALKAAQRMECEGFVGAGSIMEYESTAAIYNVNERPSQANIYSTAKLTAHYMSRILAASMDIRYVWPYITNSYGEEECSSRFLNTTVRKILSGECPTFSAATQMYDFVHVTDVAKAFYLLGQRGKNGQTYCVGSGCPQQLKEYITQMKNLLNPAAQLCFGSKPGISLDKTYFNTMSLVEDTGFCPRISFEEGILRLKEHYLE